MLCEGKERKRKKYSAGMMVSNILERAIAGSRYAEGVVWTLCLGFTDKLQPTLHSFHSLLLSMNDL